MRRRKKTGDNSDNGFAEWGGYMDAKKAKLINQFSSDAAAAHLVDENGMNNKIFNGVAIFVNGYTVPSSDELKLLMIKYGGIYNHYYDSKKTTHIVATNLPNCKIKQMKDTKVVKPDWIIDSINANKLLDYRSYLLYTNQSKGQPKLFFNNDDNANITAKPSCSFDECNDIKSSNVPFNNSTASSVLEIKRDFTESLQINGLNNEAENEIKTHVNMEHDHSEFSDEKRNVSENLKNNEEIIGDDLKNFDKFLITNQNINSEINEKKRCDSSRMTARDEKFLSEFYSNSRLHHISTMGATFKEYVMQLRSKNPQNKFPGRLLLKNWLNDSKSLKDVCDVDESLVDNNDDDDLLCDLGSNHDKIVNSSEKVIMHIDMDCFFVSVGIRNRPELKGQPVAVTHAKAKLNSNYQLRKESNFKIEIDLYKNRIKSKLKTDQVDDCDNVSPDVIVPVTRYNWADVINETNSMSEVASCSYEARKAGVKNGMFLGQALKLCPNLKTIPYDCDAYRNVSYTLYDTIAEYTLNIEAVSCDEMFVDCTDFLKLASCTPLEFATFLRKQIKEKTGCPCSTGFGGNRLQARLATKKAKPDGQYYLQQNDVAQFIKYINISDLPGVGKTLGYKLSSMGIKTCEDLQNYSLSKLKSDFGMKTGQALFNRCRGIDNAELTFGHVRKSVSAEVNYGIRFQNQDEAEKFLNQLSCEVCNRLQHLKMKTKCITLKLMVKSKEAPEETAKFLGHGFCYNISKSSSISVPVSEPSAISRQVTSLYRKLNVIPKELRGVGIQLSSLLPTDSDKTTNSLLHKFLKPKDILSKAPERNRKELKTIIRNSNDVKCAFTKSDILSCAKRVGYKNLDSENNLKVAECLSNINEAVLNELPDDVREEVIKNYKLLNYNIKINDNVGSSKKECSTTSEGLNSKVRVIRNSSKVKFNDAVFKFQDDFWSIQDNKEFTNAQVDQSFLRALPSDLREQIMRKAVYNHERKINGTNYCLRSSGGRYATQYSNKKLQSSENDDCSSTDALSLERTRDVIRKWITEKPLPLSQDIDMIFSLLEKYIYNHRLHSLKLIINTLYRSIKKKASDDGFECWKDAYSSIIKLIQDAMVIKYGGELKLEYQCI